MPWLEIVGWTGSILVVVSLMQARLLRFRWMNLVGAVLATGYNAWLGIWPFMAMNGVIAVIDVYWLVRLYREAHDTTVYEVVEVAPSDAYLNRVLAVDAADIATTHPSFDPRVLTDARGRSVWLVLRGTETVGVVVVRDTGEGTGIVELDWVSPRFRDFTPGEFVYRDSGIFRVKGFDRLAFESPPASLLAYLRRVGFVPDGAGSLWVREVTPV